MKGWLFALYSLSARLGQTRPVRMSARVNPTSKGNNPMRILKHPLIFYQEYNKGDDRC